MGPEAKIQKAVVQYAKSTSRGKILPVKAQAGRFGTGGYPDYTFYVIGGHAFFMEFKALGGKCTPRQLAQHDKLKALGFPVYVIDNARSGFEVIDAELRRL